ncbi:unnamed protein product [Closterium sp. NIES-65]|nr:unnamed protein product [Closterium sp. NIES-65]
MRNPDPPVVIATLIIALSAPFTFSSQFSNLTFSTGTYVEPSQKSSPSLDRSGPDPYFNKLIRILTTRCMTQGPGPCFDNLTRILTTRCMTQAVYFPSGQLAPAEYHHYGLAAPIYTHFTSPIRRYADVSKQHFCYAGVASGATCPFLSPNFTSLTFISLPHFSPANVGSPLLLPPLPPPPLDPPRSSHLYGANQPSTFALLTFSSPSCCFYPSSSPHVSLSRDTLPCLRLGPSLLPTSRFSQPFSPHSRHNVPDLNYRNRNAQMAGRASVELHTLIFFRTRYGIEGPVYLVPKEPHKGKAAAVAAANKLDGNAPSSDWVVDEKSQTVESKDGKRRFKVRGKGLGKGRHAWREGMERGHGEREMGMGSSKKEGTFEVCAAGNTTAHTASAFAPTALLCIPPCFSRLHPAILPSAETVRV